MRKDICICIPTKREPPIRTFEAYDIDPNFWYLIICDPTVFRAQQEHYTYLGYKNLMITCGQPGIGAQIAECYEQSVYNLGMGFWFKLDDDLAPKTFLTQSGDYPSLERVIDWHKACLMETGTTLCGPMNTTNRSWMGKGFKRTYGLVHGGANLSITANPSDRFIDRTLKSAGDVYRTLTHRVIDKAVGRLSFLGFDKSKSTVNTTVKPSEEQLMRDRQLILDKFPGMVKCNGMKYWEGGSGLNWRMTKGNFER